MLVFCDELCLMRLLFLSISCMFVQFMNETVPVRVLPFFPKFLLLLFLHFVLKTYSINSLCILDDRLPFFCAAILSK